MACEYCDGSPEQLYISDWSDEGHKGFYSMGLLKIDNSELHKPNKYLLCCGGHANGAEFFAKGRINYCPMCGRKLVE